MTCIRMYNPRVFERSKIFSLGRSWGQNAFEMDFSNWMQVRWVIICHEYYFTVLAALQLSFTDFNTDIMAYDEYFAGVHRAATEHALIGAALQ